MKKILLLTFLFTTLFSFAQVTAIAKSEDLNKVYKGGNKQLIQDLENNLSTLSSEFQVNGKFILTFDLDNSGKITNSKVLPEVNDDFAFAVIRSFKRMKNNFSADMPKKNLAVILNFSTTYKNSDGRERFTESAMTERFNNR